MIKIAFIVHGKAKQKQALLKNIEVIFNDKNFDFEVFETKFYQHTIALSKQACQSGFTHIIACGGDGTLNEALNGILQSSKENIQLGLLPYGSGNDFIKTIKSPKTLVGIKSKILEQSFQKIDIGFASFTSKEGTATSRYFLNITDVGLGGIISQQLFESKRLLGSFITYQYFIIKNLLTYKPKQLKVIGDTFTYTDKIMNFCAANAKYFGSGLGISPDANVVDGLLNAVAIGNVGLIDYFKNFPDLKKCKQLKHSQVFYYTSEMLYFESETPNFPIDMDGEFVGFLPMTITIVPKAIDFIC